MPQFEIVSDFKMTGDQPQAVAKLVEGLQSGHKYQTLLGFQGNLGLDFLAVTITALVLIGMAGWSFRRMLM